MFINITIDLAVKICTFAIPVFVLLYFVIFKKYNSRNNIIWNEIIFDAIEFITNSVIHLLIFIIGLDYMIEGLHLLDAVYERYANFIVGVVVISVVIYHYISFIKKLLVDLDPEVEKREKEINYKFGEYVLFVFLCLLLINPILSLPKFAMHIGFKDLLIKEVLMSLGCSAIAVFLLYHINPLKLLNENNKKKIKKIIEYTIFIVLFILALKPLYSISELIMSYKGKFKEVFYISLIECFLTSFVACVLLYVINPLNIRNKEKNNKKEENNVKEEFLNNVNEKVEFEDTGYDDLNKIGDKVEDIMNESTLNAPQKEKIVIPDEAELKSKKKTNKSSSSKKSSSKTNSKSNSVNSKTTSTKKKSTEKSAGSKKITKETTEK